jgi:hypothetical protein
VRIIHQPWPILGHSHPFPENHAPNHKLDELPTMQLPIPCTGVGFLVVSFVFVSLPISL